MRISRERLQILQTRISGIVGEAVAIGGDYSLSAFIKAVAIKNNEPIDQLPSLTSIEVKNVDTIDDALSCIKRSKSMLQMISVNNLGNLKFSENPFNENLEIPGFTVDWKRCKLYSEPIQSTFLVYSNITNHKIIVISESRITAYHTHLICMFYYHHAKWYYDTPEKIKEATEFGKKLNTVGSTKKDDIEASENAIITFTNEAYSMIDWNKMINLKAFTKISSLMPKLTQKRITREYENIRQNIQTLSDELSKIDKRKSDIIIELKTKELMFGTAAESMKQLSMGTIPIDPEEVSRFFEENPHLIINGIDDELGTINIIADTILNGFEPEELRTAMHNHGSAESSIRDLKHTERLFCDRLGALRCVGQFNVVELKDIEYIGGCETFPDIMCNPHFQLNCKGGNASLYAKYGDSGNWQALIEQAQWAASNWNIGDGAATRRVRDYLDEHHADVKCVYVHKDLTPVECIDETCELVTLDEFAKMLDDFDKAKLEAEKAAKAAAEAEKKATEAATKLKRKKVPAADEIPAPELEIDTNNATATDAVDGR